MYYRHFGLRGAPFSFTPPDRLFLGSTHREGLAALQWGFQEPSGLTLLVGEVGTGKTALIHSLLACQNTSVRVARITNPTLTFEQMRQFIVQELRIHPLGKGKLAILQALKTFLMDPELDNRVVLIFDEAQGLSDEILEELRLLSNSTTGNGQSLQIILVGQPELAERLREPKLRALNQRIGARTILYPLRGTEVCDYVEHLLTVQGGNLRIFSRDALYRLAQLSGGLPRAINVICHNSLLLAFSEGSTRVKSWHVRAAAAEYNNLPASPANRSFRASGAGRLAPHWLSGKGKPAVAVSILAVAALAAVFGLEWDGGRQGRWPVPAESTVGGQPQRSSPELSRALESSPPLAPARKASDRRARNRMTYDTRRADIALRARRYNNATWHLNRVVAADPDSQESRHLIAAAREAKAAATVSHPAVISSLEPSGDTTTSTAPVAKVSRIGGMDIIQDETNLGDAYMRKGDYDNALRKFRTALAMDPDDEDLGDRITRAERAKAAGAKMLP